MRVNKKGRSNNGVSSPIREHKNDMGHMFLLIICVSSIKLTLTFDLHIHESLLILRDHHTLNLQNSSLPLPYSNPLRFNSPKSAVINKIKRAVL